MKRWWGIRHVRFWWHQHCVYQHAVNMYHLGLGTGEPNPRDLLYLHRIWHGEA